MKNEGENANRRLLEACGGKAAIARNLLRRGADPNARTERDVSALHLACFFGRMDIVSLLLDAGADHLVEDAFGRTPAEAADDPDTRRLMLAAEERVLMAREAKQVGRARAGRRGRI